jgi:hypothetical protein
MKRAGFIARAENATCAALAVSMLVAVSASTANAQQPPRVGCRAVSKVEYDAARSEGLLRQKFGTYVRTGPFWRRFYWYCH